MEEILKRLSENRLNEMAMSQDKAIDRCISLGRKFIEHFHKVYEGGLGDRDFEHHCYEMQTWYNDINSIVLKSTKRHLTSTNKMDWFFTAGSDPDEFLNDLDEIESYNKLIIRLLDTNEDIIEVMEEILRREN